MCVYIFLGWTKSDFFPQVPLPLACKQLVTPELMRLVATQSSAGAAQKA